MSDLHQLLDEARALQPRVVGLRRRIHSEPELGLQGFLFGPFPRDNPCQQIDGGEDQRPGDDRGHESLAHTEERRGQPEERTSHGRRGYPRQAGRP